MCVVGGGGARLCWPGQRVTGDGGWVRIAPGRRRRPVAAGAALARLRRLVAAGEQASGGRRWRDKVRRGKREGGSGSFILDRMVQIKIRMWGVLPTLKCGIDIPSRAIMKRYEKFACDSRNGRGVYLSWYLFSFLLHINMLLCHKSCGIEKKPTALF